MEVGKYVFVAFYTENGHKLRISGKENEDSDKIGE
jgi:hypothetical protein